MKTAIFNYDRVKFNFSELIAEMIGTEDLIGLKANHATGRSLDSIYKKMEQTSAYKKLYQQLESAKGDIFYKTYRSFIKEVIQPQFDEPIYYQAKPTHRLLYKNAAGVSRFHRDQDYGHDPAEINYLVPQTPAYDTNTLWIESEIGKEDFSPVQLQPGQFVRFKGVHLEHGARKNTTGDTRVSFDFRVIPSSQFPKEMTTSTHPAKSDKVNKLFTNAHHFVLCE